MFKSKVFNVVADKVVNLRELNKRIAEAHAANLTSGEKVFLKYVDKPLSLIAGLIPSFNTPRKGMTGVYFDTRNPCFYVSGVALNRTFAKAAAFTLVPGFQDKTNKLTAEAFEQCEDLSQKPIMAKLTAL